MDEPKEILPQVLQDLDKQALVEIIICQGEELPDLWQQTLRLEMNDGALTQGWDTDPGLLEAGKLHHIMFIVDGAPNIITVAVDGKLCDGGSYRQYGWGRFSEKLKDANGSKKIKVASCLHGQIKNLRIYNRYLRTSEAISNFRAGINN